MLPFHRFRTPEGKGVDPLLGPEMKSTGEVMGFDASFGAVFAESQAAAYGSLPTSGRVFVSIADRDKRAMVFPVLRLAALGFEVLATAVPPRWCVATGSPSRRCASTTRAARPSST